MENQVEEKKRRGRRKKSEMVQSATQEFKDLQKEQLRLFEFLIKENDKLKSEIEKDQKFKNQWKKIQKLTAVDSETGDKAGE